VKILEIRLMAFGPFTDVVLDLSRGSDHGLHIIYGPNEAGKSASLRALTALFFGIPVRTADNFIHDNQSLRLGARIGNSHGEELEIVRRKGSKDTLLDREGRAIPDAMLARYLGGAGEELFRSMFGIDHESLVRGGEQVLRGGGAVGESLFAAGMGGTNLHEVRRGLEEEAQKLFLPRGRSQSISLLINAFNEAKQRSQQASLSSREWVEHDTALREAATMLDRVTIELRRVESEKNRLDRFRKAIPLIAERKELLSKLEAIGKVKDLSPAFGKKRREAVQKLENAADAEKGAVEALARIREKIEALVIPEGLLLQADNVMGLHERLGSHRKAFKDLHRLQGETAQLASDAETMVKELRPDVSLEGVEVLRITAAGRARIRELGNRHQTLVERVARCVRDEKNLDARLVSRKETLKGLETTRDVGKLRSVLSRVQKQGDMEEDLKSAVAEREAGREQLAVELKKLGLWSGPVEDLESLPVPAPETVDRFDKGFNKLDSRLQSLLDRMKQADERRADLDRQIAELRMAGQVVSEEDLDRARERRALGWSLVRRSWLDGREEPEELLRFDPHSALPEAYEKSVADSDQVADRLRREADRVAGHAALVSQRKKFVEELDEYKKQESGIRLEMDRLRLEWQALWGPLGIKPLTPNEMRSWAARQDRTAQMAARLKTVQGRIDMLDRRVGEYRAALGECLEELGEKVTAGEGPLHALVTWSTNLVARIDEESRKRKDLQQEVGQLEDDLAVAVRDREASSAELVRWQTDWSAAVKGLGLLETASPAEANSVVDRIEDLFKRIDKIAGLNGRIAGIERDAAEFERDVRGLCELLAPDLAGLPPEQAVPELNMRLQKARQDSAALAELREREREKEQAIQHARETIHRSEAQLKELCREAGCSRFDELEEIEDRSARAMSVRKDRDALERQLLGHGGGSTLDELTAEAGRIDADSLPALIAGLAEQVDELERKRSELLERIGREKSLLQMMDGRAEAAEAAETAQSLLAQLREEANRYVSLRLASAVLHREIERYRSENQDPVLRKTSELFSALTLGSFAALRTDFNESDEPILLGVRPGGERVGVQGMSEGTRDQLYLALRLASLDRYLDHNEPMPLILDDILINFDDSRSEATLKVLEVLSRKTQVIFFTHHAHLVELARSAVSSTALQVHMFGADTRSMPGGS
jgi:uncharacterized protein YhaN